jgi:hypothetical protein
MTLKFPKQISNDMELEVWKNLAKKLEPSETSINMVMESFSGDNVDDEYLEKALTFLTYGFHDNYFINTIRKKLIGFDVLSADLDFRIFGVERSNRNINLDRSFIIREVLLEMNVAMEENPSMSVAELLSNSNLGWSCADLIDIADENIDYLEKSL